MFVVHSLSSNELKKCEHKILILLCEQERGEIQLIISHEHKNQGNVVFILLSWLIAVSLAELSYLPVNIKFIPLKSSR